MNFLKCKLWERRVLLDPDKSKVRRGCEIDCIATDERVHLTSHSSAMRIIHSRVSALRSMID